MTPGSCSMGIHILLEEVDTVFEVDIVNLLQGDQYSEAFLKINPKASIPVLLTADGEALTDFVSIAWWLAVNYPKAQLLPGDSSAEVKVLDVMNYVVGTIHMQGFARIFTTDKFARNESDFDWVKQQGREIVNKGLAVVNNMLSEKGYVLNQFSIADAALFYVEFWAIKTDITLPPACLKHYQMMLNRMSVRQVMYEEGYAADLTSNSMRKNGTG